MLTRLKPNRMSLASDPCNDANVQSDVLHYHRIDQTTFETWVTSFFQTPLANIVPKHYLAQAIYDMIFSAAVTCDYYVMASEMPPFNNTDNTNIMLQVLPPAAHGITSYYTMILFRAFFSATPAPASFDFYKAYKLEADNDTIIDEIIFFKITATDGTISYWDLSGSVPPRRL